MISDDLFALETKISAELAQRPECFITHPAEVQVFEQISEGELNDFAHRHGWRVVRRLGGKQIQFYNDATEQLRSKL